MKWGKIPRVGVQKKFGKDEWADYYQTVNGYRPVAPAKRKRGSSGWFRIISVLVILAALVIARQFPHPAGEQVRENMRYLLTAEWNFRPVLDKSMQLAAQLVNWDNPVVNSPPGLDGVSQPVTGDKLANTEISVPVSGKVIREYGWSQSSIDDLERFHSGIDISSPVGSSVTAALDGKVTRVSKDASLGQYITIDHGNGTHTLYGGVTDVMIVEGEEVKAGQEIAVVGEGDVAGGGLHFELREDDKLIDPLTRMQANNKN